MQHNLLGQGQVGFAIILLRASLLRCNPCAALEATGDMWVNFYGIPLTLFDTRLTTCTVPHYCVTNHSNIANVNAVGVAFKASNSYVG